MALRGIGEEPEIRIQEVIDPDPSAASQYDTVYQTFRTLHPILAASMHDLAAFSHDSGGRP
jgi:hypothetical protein